MSKVDLHLPMRRTDDEHIQEIQRDHSGHMVA